MVDEVYAPNQQFVRPDGSGPAEEGTGGSTQDDDTLNPTEDLDSLTKDDLLAYAQGLGVSPANASMTKDDLKAGIAAHREADA